MIISIVASLHIVEQVKQFLMLRRLKASETWKHECGNPLCFCAVREAIMYINKYTWRPCIREKVNTALERDIDSYRCIHSGCPWVEDMLHSQTYPVSNFWRILVKDFGGPAFDLQRKGGSSASFGSHLPSICPYAAARATISDFASISNFASLYQARIISNCASSWKNRVTHK